MVFFLIHWILALFNQIAYAVKPSYEVIQFHQKCGLSKEVASRRG